MINLIACVTTFKNKLAIGRNNDLLFKLKDDMEFFKNITTNSLSSVSKINKNIVLMGRKTWFSIPNKFRPLSNRINLILTNDIKLINSNVVPKDLETVDNCVYFINMEMFKKIYRDYNPNVFVIGGSDIYNYFLKNKELSVDKIYLTHVQTKNLTNVKFDVILNQTNS